jgi:hypothetical protein
MLLTPYLVNPNKSTLKITARVKLQLKHLLVDVAIEMLLLQISLVIVKLQP